MLTQDKSNFVFAYGSLIWRPGFTYQAVSKASVAGFERRFWQASHDHRGTPELPGRVVTLVPVPNGSCWGLVYRLPETGLDVILSELDHREKDGYRREWLSVHSEQWGELQALTWVATEQNPSWRGGEPVDKLAHLISQRTGPSGSNVDYLMNLSQALIECGINDPYIELLTESVARILAK